MKTYEIQDLTIEVPEKWAEVKLSTWDVIHKMPVETPRELSDYVATLVGKNPGFFNALPAELFNRVADDIAFLYKPHGFEACPSIELEGVRYFIRPEKKISFAEFIDLNEAQKGTDKVLATTLAILCRPDGEEYTDDNNEERAAMFGELTMDKALPLIAFFLYCGQRYEIITRHRSQVESLVNQLQSSINSMRTTGAGMSIWTTWQTVKFFFLRKYLNYLLRRCVRSLHTVKTAATL